MPDALVNDTHLVLGEVTGDAADKQGIASIIVPVIVPDLPTAFSISPVDVQTAVGISAFACIGRPFHQIEGGLYQVNFHFEGINETINGPQSQSSEKTEWDFDLEMENAPIQTHPSFNSFKSTYSWTTTGADGSPGFSETWSGGAAGAGLTGGQDKTQPNPFFGTTDWLKVGGIYSRSYAVSGGVPAGIYDAIGTLVPVPPDAEMLGITSFPGRAWLKMAPKTSRRSNATRIVERFRLTGQDLGAAKVIYAQAQLGNGNTG